MSLAPRFSEVTEISHDMIAVSTALAKTIETVGSALV
jgi:hypothetical protein